MFIRTRTCSFILLILIATAMSETLRSKAEANGRTSFAPRFEGSGDQNVVSAATAANSKIVFTRAAYSPSGPDIYTVNPDGSGILNLTPYLGRPTRDTSPAWSPAGTRIAFISDRDGNPELYMMDANGNNIVRLTNTPTLDEAQPEWSPDGVRIAFVRLARNSSESTNIFVMNADGNDVRQLTTGRLDRSPAWSPDGAQIAFESFRDGSTSALYAMNADGSNQRRLFNTPGASDSSPDWSPDGTRIVFTVGRVCIAPCAEIHLLSVNTGEARYLTGNQIPSFSPAWSPDGTQITFAGDPLVNESPGIYVMNADGSSVRRITNLQSQGNADEAADSEPDWGITPKASGAGEIAFNFAPDRFSVPENVGSATVTVRRSGGGDGRGDLDREARVQYLASNLRLIGAGCVYTADVGTATPGADFIEARGELVFAPGEESKTFRVQINDDAEYEVGITDGGVPRVPRIETVFLTLDYSQYAPPNTERCYGAGGILEIVDDDNPVIGVEAKTWTIDKRSYAYVKLTFPDNRYQVLDWKQIVPSGNDFSVTVVIGTPFLSTPTIRTPNTTAHIYELGELPPGSYTFSFRSNITPQQNHSFVPSNESGGTNPNDDAREFVRQHYLDFLNREPDLPGLEHWTREITMCSEAANRREGESEAACIDRKRVNTSGAFFLSLEHQATGYYVYRLYKGSLGRAPYLSEYQSDVADVSRGIVVNNALLPDVIERNKEDFARRFMERAEFRSRYDTLSNADYVERMFYATGFAPPPAEVRAALVSGLNSGTEPRVSVLRKIVDGTRIEQHEGQIRQVFTTDYGESFYRVEFNRAFVLMQYFSYLRRDPDQEGYNFWLAKLNRFGNFTDAQMVRAFILSHEYRARFGQP